MFPLAVPIKAFIAGYYYWFMLWLMFFKLNAMHKPLPLYIE